MTPEHAKVDPVFKSVDTAGATKAGDSGPEAGGSVGSSLRTLREARGWTIADVSARLKFAPRQIEALEADRWEALPQGPSLRGLIRNYARMLDVPADTLLQALPAHLLPSPAPVAHLNPVDSHSTDLPAGTTLPGWSEVGGRRLGWGGALALLLLVAVLGLAAYLFFAWWLPRDQAPESGVSLPFAIEGQVGSIESSEPVEGSVASVMRGVAASGPAIDGQMALPGADATPLAGERESPAQEAVADGNGLSPSAPAVALTDSTSPTAPFIVPGLEGDAAPVTVSPDSAEPEVLAESPPTNEVGLTITGESWVEVRDGQGNVVLSATLQPGQSRQLAVDPPARVVIGNANGVQLEWQGEAVNLASHQRGNVARLTLE